MCDSPCDESGQTIASASVQKRSPLASSKVKMSRMKRVLKNGNHL